jgi:pimeloyl-ACP methyl ester carboxylesterase
MTQPDEPQAHRRTSRDWSRVGPNHVERAGSGAEVVLVHAGVADSRMWGPQWDVWPRSYRVTRLDLRGFGRSDPPLGPFSHAADVLAVLDDAEIERAVLVGASFGGRVVLDLAASRPARVAGLVLADAGLPDHDWSPEIRAFGVAEDEALEAGDLDAATAVNVDFWLPHAPEKIRAAIREQQRNAFALQVGSEGEEHLLTDGLGSRLGEVDVPTLVLVGESDYADFHAIADRLSAGLRRSTRETIPGAGHLPSLERPEAFDAVVLPFLESMS